MAQESASGLAQIGALAIIMEHKQGLAQSQADFITALRQLPQKNAAKLARQIGDVRPGALAYWVKQKELVMTKIIAETMQASQLKQSLALLLRPAIQTGIANGLNATAVRSTQFVPI